jgi:hypothetical protein
MTPFHKFPFNFPRSEKKKSVAKIYHSVLEEGKFYWWKDHLETKNISQKTVSNITTYLPTYLPIYLPI